MPVAEKNSGSVLFGPFELLLDTMELRKGGGPIKLTGQAIQVLAMLVARPGQLVTRTELQEKLWPGDTFGDFEHGLNAAVNRLRDKLGDSASSPLYIETLAGRGYRFVGNIEPPSVESTQAAAPDPKRPTRPFKRWGRVSIALVVVCGAVVSVLLIPGLRRAMLRTADLAPSAPEERQLAVLPFVALNDAKDTGAFAKGLAETIASRLNKFTEKHSLQIISTRQLAESNIDSIPKARREFGVNLGLDGSVEQSGSMVRVSYHLIDAKTLRQLGADTITAPASNTFMLEDEVAESVAKALDLQLQPNEKAPAALNSRTEPSAYDFYLQGLGYLQDYIKPGNLDSAITVFQHAVALSSRYAPAHAGLGEAYWYRYQDTHDPKWVKDATEQCDLAVEYDDGDFRGHICLGTIFEGSGEFEKAAQQFDRALKLEPASDDAVRGLAAAYNERNETAKAEETYHKAIALRPQNWLNYNMLGVFYYSRGRYNEAAKMFKEVIALAPDNYRGYSNLGGIYLLEGLYHDALPLFQMALSIQPTGDAYSNLGTTYFYLRDFRKSADAFSVAIKQDDQNYVIWGNLANAEVRIPGMQPNATEAYRHAIDLAERDLRVNPSNAVALAHLADYYSMLGDRSKALGYIHRALAIGSNDASVIFKAAQVYEEVGQSELAVTYLLKALDAGYAPTMARDMPGFDSLRSDPRIVARLQRQ